MIPRPPGSTLFPYTTLFRSRRSTSPRATAARFSRAQCSIVANADCTETRSEEHTSELQSRFDLVCRLLLEKKKITLLGHDIRRWVFDGVSGSFLSLHSPCSE